MTNQSSPMTNSSINEDPTINTLSSTTVRLTNGNVYTKLTSTNQQDNGILHKQRKLVLHFDNRNTLQVSSLSYEANVYRIETLSL